MSVTTAIRLLAGFGLFLLIAHQWGATRFGEFMYLFSVASLLVLVCEFGFSQQVLREVGHSPEQARIRMANYLGAKLWLSLLTVLLACVFGWSRAGSLEQFGVLLLLLLAGVALSFADLLMACFRALGFYRQETAVTVQANLVFVVVVIVAVFLSQNPIIVAGGFLIARLVGLSLTVHAYKRKLPGDLGANCSIASAASTARAGLAYGADVAVSTAFVNLDTVLVANVLGYAATGVYQLGARIYQGACLFAPIFGGVFLPRMSRNAQDRDSLYKDSSKLTVSMSVFGAILCVTLVAASLASDIVLAGTSFEPAKSLLPWFGLLLFVRYVASAYGIVVTAMGAQRLRAGIYVCVLPFLVGISFPLMQTRGVAGMVMAIALAYLVLTAGFCLIIGHKKFRPPYVIPVLVFAAAFTALGSYLERI